MGEKTDERFCEFCGRPADGMAIGAETGGPRIVILACAEHGDRAAALIKQEESKPPGEPTP